MPRRRYRLGVQRFVNDAVLLDEVRGRVALAWAGAPRTAAVAQLDLGRQALLQPVPDRAPGAHVLRLLLRPHDFAEIRVAGEHGLCALGRERIELLEPGDGDAARICALLVTGDVVIDLPLAEHEPLDALATRARVVEH